MSARSQTIDLQSESSAESCKRRLLEAGGQVFAELGFRNATVREICKRANANIAAINYHFGDKAGLYSAVMRSFAGLSLATYPPDMDLPPDPTPAQRLHAFVRSMLFRISDKDKPGWFGKLLARELVDPTHALDERIEENARPMTMTLVEIVRDLVGRDLPEPDLRRAVCSIMGQVYFYHTHRNGLDRLFPGQQYEPADIERLARHITDFTIGGLRQMREKA